MKYKRLKENLNVMCMHNHTQGARGRVVVLTNGRKTENQVIDEVVSDCREILNKIEQGTLIELPCKVGDTVYSNERIMFEPIIVKTITTHQSMNLPVSYTVFATAKDGYGIYLSSENFNENWFLTKDETKKKLKELQNG